jgi:hypothetical protein
MHKQSIIFIFLIFGTQLLGQDVILKRNGEKIKAKVIEITTDAIKYKDYDFQDGPLRNIRITDIQNITYENGRKETFIQEQPQIGVSQSQTSQQDQNTTSSSSYKGNYFMIGTGFGNSYGVIGFRAQARFGGKVGFGIHGGLGLVPDEGGTALSAGVKFFPYKGLYIDTQLGFWRYHESYYYSGMNYDETDWEICPTFMVGVDQVWGQKVGIGFNAGMGLSIPDIIGDPAMGWILDDVGEFLAIDLGFIVRF